MKIRFLGADGTVTGSKHLLIGHKHNILIDCGLYQGLNEVKHSKELAALIKSTRVDAVILTHAHLDHSGYLPRLVRDGFEGPIFCTNSTRDLARIVLKDNAKIQQYKKKHDPHYQDTNFYSEPDINKTLAHIHSYDFHQTFQFKEFEIEFFHAGHILGAASPLIKSNGLAIQFSGDLGNFDDYMIKGPDLASENAQYICMESTYGNRKHSNEDPVEALKEIITNNLEKQGTLIIPAFSIGRSQLMMYLLYQVFEQYPGLETPVYMDSPMTQAVTELYPRYAHELAIEKSLFKKVVKKFKFLQFESEKENFQKNQKAKIILTASGMMDGGNIHSHLKSFAPEKHNTLLVVGYQAEGTVGRRLLQGTKTIELEEEVVEINCEVINLPLFSSHLDSEGLIRWLSKSNAKNILLTHGEPEQLEAFKKTLKETYSVDVHIAKLSEILPLKSVQ